MKQKSKYALAQEKTPCSGCFDGQYVIWRERITASTIGITTGGMPNIRVPVAYTTGMAATPRCEFWQFSAKRRA